MSEPPFHIGGTFSASNCISEKGWRLERPDQSVPTQGIQAEEFLMLKTLFSSAKKLLCPSHNPGYQTKIYLTVGKPLVLHDSLDFGPLATAKEIEHLTKFWQIEETTDADLTALNQRGPALSFESFSEIDYAGQLACLELGHYDAKLTANAITACLLSSGKRWNRTNRRAESSSSA